MPPNEPSKLKLVVVCNMEAAGASVSAPAAEIEELKFATGAKHCNGAFHGQNENYSKQTLHEI